jgi:signal transduction histidine kinase
MINSSIVYQILAFLIIILGLWLAFWVYLANRKARINQVFFLFTFSFLLWAPLPYFFNLPQVSHLALYLVRFGYGIVSLFMVALYFFAAYFPREEKKYVVLNKIVLCVGLLFFFLSIFTNLIIQDVESTRWGINPLFGAGKIPYFGTVFLLTLLSVSLLFKKYFILSRKEKLKIQYVFIGLTIFILPNLIFNVIFPFLGKEAQAQYYPFGNYSAIFLLGFTAYAIVKRELFGIKVVLTQMLVGAIGILLLVNIIGSESTFEYIWKGVLFVTFLLFGYLLIKSVLREIKQREKIEKMASDLQQAYQDLKKLDKAKSEFLSIASHQLRTPLTAIKGYLSMVLEGRYGKINQKLSKPIKNVYKASEQLNQLVNTLLNISRIEAGRIKINKKPTDIRSFLKQNIEELKIVAEGKELYLKLNIETDLDEILIDKEKMSQALLNIIDNAIKYTEKGGISVDVFQKRTQIGKGMIIRISDTGMGMTQKEINDLFQKFLRGPAGEKLWTGGSGLGLYIAKKFVEMHNGKIEVKSKGINQGTTFLIELPLN